MDMGQHQAFMVENLNQSKIMKPKGGQKKSRARTRKVSKESPARAQTEVSQHTNNLQMPLYY